MQFSNSATHTMLLTFSMWKTLWQIVRIITDFNLGFRGEKKFSCLDGTSLRRRKTETTKKFQLRVMGLIITKTSTTIII